MASGPVCLCGTRRFIAAEKQYARDFLGHVNPYTGKPYTEEPAVAFVEIINENGILCAWPRGRIKKLWSAALVADLQAAWNVYLKQKYRTTVALRRAWAEGETGGEGGELLQNPDFHQGTAKWTLQCVAPSKGELNASQDGYDGKPCLVATCDSKSNASWHVNLQQTGLVIKRGHTYQLSFAAKADVPVQPRASVTKASPPYSDLGLSMTPDLSNQWRRFSQRFVAPKRSARAG